MSETTIDVSRVTLLNFNNFPPKGWVYREPSLNWPPKGFDFLRSFDVIVGEMQMVRAQNPASNLDPSPNACAKALVAYTCARLQYDPRWCGLPPLEQQAINARYPEHGRRGCASCGRR